jgi:hypothetical protein
MTSALSIPSNSSGWDNLFNSINSSIDIDAAGNQIKNSTKQGVDEFTGMAKTGLKFALKGDHSTSAGRLGKKMTSAGMVVHGLTSGAQNFYNYAKQLVGGVDRKSAFLYLTKSLGDFTTAGLGALGMMDKRFKADKMQGLMSLGSKLSPALMATPALISKTINGLEEVALGTSPISDIGIGDHKFLKTDFTSRVPGAPILAGAYTKLFNQDADRLVGVITRGDIEAYGRIAGFGDVKNSFDTVIKSIGNG